MLQRSLPEGLLADSAWMEKHGYSRALRKKYVAHGWLDQVSRGLYRRPVPEVLDTDADRNLRWQNVVVSLQALLDAQFAVGGRTALEVQGFAHYLSTGPEREVHLYGTGKLPSWVFKVNLQTRFVTHQG
ncbi:MAG TPA: AbiEi antitoxin N-terminal domain-containing protein [Candidatus Methylomirabilis sp.]|nr:AbiEi antitoxin N-terminal domain-containing protein [Candidatus Methylomirabilis sp.]